LIVEDATAFEKWEKYAYRMAQKVAHFSTHHIFGTVQDKIKRISSKCSVEMDQRKW